MTRGKSYASKGRAGAAERHQRFSTPDWSGEQAREQHGYRPEAPLAQRHDAPAQAKLRPPRKTAARGYARPDAPGPPKVVTPAKQQVATRRKTSASAGDAIRDYALPRSGTRGYREPSRRELAQFEEKDWPRVSHAGSRASHPPQDSGAIGKPPASKVPAKRASRTPARSRTR